MYQPPFNISDEMLTLVAEISERIGGLNMIMDNQHPQPLLRKQNRIKTIQSSLAIENNTLSIEQVTAIVEGKRVLGPPNEIQEVKCAIAASDRVGNSSAFILFMLQCIKNTIDKLVLPKKTSKKTSKKTPKDIILKLIATDAKVTIEQMSEALGMNKRNAQKHVNQLVNDGIIVRVGANRGGHWEILDK